MKLEPIDTSTTAGKAEVMRLAAEGRRVAVRGRGGMYSFEVTLSPVWDWGCGEYAIIAEPAGPDEVWIQQRDGALWAYPEEREGSIRYVRTE